MAASKEVSVEKLWNVFAHDSRGWAQVWPSPGAQPMTLAKARRFAKDLAAEYGDMPHIVSVRPA